MTRKPYPKRLTRAKRLEARYMAEDMMAQLTPEREIRQAIEDRFGVSQQASRDVFHEAWVGMAAAEAEDRPQRRGKVERALELLYSKAWTARQWTTCARILKQMQDLFGLNAPIKVEGLLAGSRTAEQERTDQELDYYSAHGHWPEEAPRKPAPVAERDPLAGLH